MEKNLTIVSSKTAKELKDFGFDIICPNCYGVAIMHNGEYLGCDEEYELRAEGRGDEIEYVEYGMLYGILIVFFPLVTINDKHKLYLSIITFLIFHLAYNSLFPVEPLVI